MTGSSGIEVALTLVAFADSARVILGTKSNGLCDDRSVRAGLTMDELRQTAQVSGLVL